MLVVVAASKAQTTLPVRLAFRAVGGEFPGVVVLWNHGLPLYPNSTVGDVWCGTHVSQSLV